MLSFSVKIHTCIIHVHSCFISICFITHCNLAKIYSVIYTSEYTFCIWYCLQYFIIKKRKKINIVCKKCISTLIATCVQKIIETSFNHQWNTNKIRVKSSVKVKRLLIEWPSLWHGHCWFIAYRAYNCFICRFHFIQYLPCSDE